MNDKLGLSEEEQIKINTICDYLFFDQFSETATYLRFERCFQPLFSEEDNIELDDLFQEICGYKKKYLNYKRFVSSYLKYKENKTSKELKAFYDKLFNSVLSKDSVGEFEGGRLTFSTRKANRNRECITLIEVLNDKEGVIHGINVTFDDIFKNKLYPKKIEDNLSVGLEVSLKILDEDKLEKKEVSKYIKAAYFRDAITHIFGTIDQESKIVTFLGFKCISGKTQFVGFPKGKSFLLGDFGKKINQIKCQMTEDGLTTILPYFEKNHRINHYLSKKIPELTVEDLSKDEIILDESYLAKLTDKNEIEKFITTVLIDDSHFFNFKLKDDIFGNSLKEVINKKPKRWMMKKIDGKKRERRQKSISLNDFMRKFEEEHRRRGRFFRHEVVGYPGFNPRFALLNRNRRHRRRRLRPFGFGHEGFPHFPFGGGFPQRQFSPFKPYMSYGPFEHIPPSMRSFSLPHHPNYFGPTPFYNPPPQAHDNFGMHGRPPMGSYDFQGRNNYYNEGNFGRQGDYYQSQYNMDNNNIVLRGRRNNKTTLNEQLGNSQPINQKEINEQNNIDQNTGNKEENKGEAFEEDDDDDEDVLIPDEHPELNTSLEELDEQLESIRKLLKKKDLKKEEREKLMKLEKLYTQQKNILIDNEEEKEKEEMMKKNDIKLDDFIKEEEEKRQMIEESEGKLIEIELDKNADKAESVMISVITKPNPERIFRKQKIYVGDKPWNDPMFTPSKQTLCPYNDKGWLLPENVLISDVEGWEKYNWCRVEEILNSKNYQVFEEGISADDILQGSIGDCYFLSAVGSLCKFSHYIDKLFFTKEKTKEHLYGVFIYLNGSWKLVLIDDFLPFTGQRFKKFAFSSSAGKELWVAFLEKAWAKINGSYAKIGCGGSPTEVFDILTEAFSEQVPINPYYRDYIWETIYDAEKKGYIMTAGTSVDIFNLNIEGVGLSAGHAYTVLGVMEIDTGKGIEKVVRLRNPYGNGEFNGDWSDYSKKWTPELKKKYNIVQKDDGSFYMGYDDFLTYYITLGICKLHPGFKTTSLRMKKTTETQVTKITVPKGEVLAYLQLYQKNPRVRLKDGSYQKLVYSFLILVDQDFNYIFATQSANMHIGIEQTLKEGTYYLFSDVNYRYANQDKKNRSYVVTCYAQTPLNIENVTKNVDVTQGLQKCIYSYCRQYVPPTKCSNGVYLYRTSTSMDSLPFEAAVFENYTPNNYRVKVNAIGKGQKSFCFYNDEIATENDISIIKELPVHSVAVFTILKYSLSSIVTLKYFFAPLKELSPNNPTSIKAPKICPEKPVLQPEANINNNQFGMQVQNMNMNNAQNVQSQQYIQGNEQYNPYQQNMMANTQIAPAQQNIQTTQQFVPKTNIPKNNNQFVPKTNAQVNQYFKPYQQNIQNMQNNAQFIPKTNIQNNKQFIPKKNVQNNNYYNNQNNMAYNYQNQAQYQYPNMQMNVPYAPYSQNVPKTNTNYPNSQVPKKVGNPVFKTQGQIINQDGTLVQYSMVNGDNYVIGLENRSNMKVRLQLYLEGLVLSNTGKNYAVFFSNPRERKIFNAKILNNYNGQIYFEFQYA